MHLFLLFLYNSVWEEEKLQNLFDANFELRFTQADIRMHRETNLVIHFHVCKIPVGRDCFSEILEILWLSDNHIQILKFIVNGASLLHVQDLWERSCG